MIIFCGEGGNKSDNYFCQFEASIYSDVDAIKLDNDNSFYQFLHDGEKNIYNIYFPEDIKKKIMVEILIFSGDVHLVLNNLEGIEIDSYLISNKILYYITITSETTIFEFQVGSNNPSFYMIHYKIIDNDYTDITAIESGINYISSFDLQKENINEKHIHFIIPKSGYDAPYIASFYSPNCKIKTYLKNGTTDIETETSFDNYAQKIIEIDENNFTQDIYDFYYKIDNLDESLNSNRFCLVYVSGIELFRENDQYKYRPISLSEGVPHRYTFTIAYPFIFYTYHIIDKYKTLVINFNLIDKAFFLINLYIGDNNCLKNISIIKNSQLYLYDEDFKNYCPDKEEICSIIIECQMKNSTKEKNVEITVYQLDNLPFYLQKNMIKEDVIHGSFAKHYYFDISNGEYGYITLDFKRGNGLIYATIQPRNFNVSINQNDWRGYYKFPNSIKESLTYATYGKTILIKENDTDKCSKGCYVLITIISNFELPSSIDIDKVAFKITINPRIFTEDKYIYNSKILIFVNEFIIGDLAFISEEKKLYDYYSVKLPYESESVIFDCQANGLYFIINIGPENPTIQKADFIFPPSCEDAIHKITRKQIITLAGLNEDSSLKDIELTIGIYSNFINNKLSYLYSFIIYMPPNINSLENKKGLNIIYIKSERKVQCLIHDYKNGFKACIFAIIFEDMELVNNLIIYPRSRKGQSFQIFGKFVDREIMDLNNFEAIESLLNEEIFLVSDCFEEGLYIFKENIDTNKVYLFMAIESQNDGDIIEVFSSTYSYYNDSNLFLNQYQSKILAIEEKYINLNLLTTTDFSLNIELLSGSGQFYWDEDGEEEKKYYLNKINNRLTLIKYADKNERKFEILKAKAIIENENKKEGFIFFIEYYPRYDINKMKEGSSTDIHYGALNMPIYYYSLINRNFSWAINVNFYEIGFKNDSFLFYDENLFNIWATIFTEKDIIRMKFEHQFKPKYNLDTSVLGVVDQIFGTLYINLDEINKIRAETDFTDSSDNYFIFLSIEKAITDEINFSHLEIELNLYSDYNSSVYNSIQQGKYFSGKLSNFVGNKIGYLLNLDNNMPFLRVEYATNSNLVQCVLSSNLDNEKNDDFSGLEINEEFGRKLITVQLSNDFINFKGKKLFLIIFLKELIDANLDFYIFRYLTSNDKSEFQEYLNENSSQLIVSKLDNNKYKISFNMIQMEDVSYYIKAFYDNKIVPNQKLDTIAFSSSNGTYGIINNIKNINISKLQFELESSAKIAYIKIMAKVNSNNLNIFYLYSPYKIIENDYINITNSINLYKTNEIFSDISTYIFEKIDNKTDLINNIINNMINDFNKTDIYKNIYKRAFEDNLKIIFSPLYYQQFNESDEDIEIDLKECEFILKNAYNISHNNTLYILKLIVREIGMKIPKVEYEVYYPLNNSDNLTKLNLNYCKGSKIDISIPVDINESNFKHNSNSEYYNNICFKAKSIWDTDISLKIAEMNSLKII